jgi:hypothetical protein
MLDNRAPRLRDLSARFVGVREMCLSMEGAGRCLAQPIRMDRKNIATARRDAPQARDRGFRIADRLQLMHAQADAIPVVPSSTRKLLLTLPLGKPPHGIRDRFIDVSPPDPIRMVGKKRQDGVEELM